MRINNAQTGAPETPSFEFILVRKKMNSEIYQKAANAITIQLSTVGEVRFCGDLQSNAFIN